MFLSKRQTTKIPRDPHGSTLIISMIILSVVLATALAYAVTSVSNYKQAVNIDQAIVAYYNAEIGVERGAYYFRQLNDDNLSDNNPAGCGVINCSLSIQPLEKMVVPLLEKDKSLQLDVYNLSETANDIRYFSTDWTSPGFPDPYLEASWVGWTGSSFSPPAKKNITAFGGIVNLQDSPVGDKDFYRVRFKSILNDIQDLTIIAQAADGSARPIPGLSEVKAIGAYGRSRQANAMITSHLYPLSGLYDFLLFSEEEISKTYCGNGVVEGSEQCDNDSQCSNGIPCSSDTQCAGIGDELCLPRDLGDGDYCDAKCECKNPTNCN